MNVHLPSHMHSRENLRRTTAKATISTHRVLRVHAREQQSTSACFRRTRFQCLADMAPQTTASSSAVGGTAASP